MWKYQQNSHVLSAETICLAFSIRYVDWAGYVCIGMWTVTGAMIWFGRSVWWEGGVLESEGVGVVDRGGSVSSWGVIVE